MDKGDKYKFWNFSRGERRAVVVLLCCIGVILFFRFYEGGGTDVRQETDFLQFKSEISEFENQVSAKDTIPKIRKKDIRKKQKPVYLRRVQSFDPVERETP